MGPSARDGEHRWFGALFATHYPAVFRYASRRVAADTAADVTAEVFLVAWRRRDEVPRDSLPWLYGVARGVIANHRRTVTRQDRLAAHVAASTRHSPLAAPPTPDLVVEHAAEISAFAAAFRRLSEDDREVLGLVAWEQLSAPQLARVLGCSVPAATMRLHRARRRLRAALDADRRTDRQTNRDIDVDTAGEDAT